MSRRSSTLSSRNSVRTSFSSLRGTAEASSTITAPDPHNSTVRRRNTNSATAPMIGSRPDPDARARTGSSDTSAGMKVTESTNEMPTPVATSVPR